MDDNQISTMADWRLPNEDAQKKAECDYLTGLANRRGLNDYYSSLSKDYVLHAMFLDVDNFKRVNDIYGHSTGDKLLVCIGNLIQNHIHGFASRIGGDEYVLLLNGSMPKENVEAIAKSMLADLQCLDFRKDILSLISLSIGIVFQQSTSQTLDDVLAKCDAAMYQAKYDGKNRYTIYNSNDKTLETNRNIELEMEDALKNGEFHVYLQPKVNMISSCLYGAEALSRWIHPVDGLRMPNVYIPLFNKNGFIAKLDMYIFEETCRLKAQWKDEVYAHIPVSVNMSRLHLYKKHFPDDLEAIANKYGIPPEELELELTESIFVKDSEELLKMVTILQQRGFSVSIDNYGSGFSALNLLKDLEVNTIKIDKEFLRMSSSTARGKKVLRSVIGMCRDLKIDIVTEGIETKEQASFITKCGCQIAQGFYYSKPLSVDDFVNYANDTMKNNLNYFSFRLDGDLKSNNAEMKAFIVGEGLEYQDGIFSDSKSLFFPGGSLGENILQLPSETIVNDSYTISMWVKPKELHQWAAAMYVKFENGFSGMIPFAWDGHSDFRIRDSKEVNGWYDTSGTQLYEDIWWHFAASYNAQTETACLFINGNLANMMEGVPTNRYCKLIMVGGDVFQNSFIGNICEIMIYNEAKDLDFISNLHEEYREKSNFTAFKTTEE